MYATYRPFNGGREIAVTDRKEVLEKDGVERFTSLLALYTVTKKLKKLFHKQQGTLETELDNVAKFQHIVVAFFDFVIEYEASLKKYFKQKRTTLATERKNNKNLFFRPVGLEVLARLYFHFYSRNKLSRLATGLSRIDFSNPDGIFDGILWSNRKIIARSKEKTAAVDLCLYILGEVDVEQSEELLLTLKDITKNSAYCLPPKLQTS